MVDKSEKFRWLVRLGYLARAILYVMLGVVALTSAQKISQGTDGIFSAVEDFPAGEAVLWIMALGLVGYSLFRFASLVFDIEHNGSDAKGWATRIGHAGSGIGHLVLAWSAVEIVSTVGGSSGGGAQEAASGVLGMEFGSLILGILGVIFFGVALYQFKKGLSGDFMHRIASSAGDFTRLLGGIGFCARGVVYGIVGWSLLRVGLGSGNAREVRTLGDALAELAGSGVIFTLTAAGLLVFGIFSTILARYRIIPDLAGSGRAPNFRAP